MFVSTKFLPSQHQELFSKLAFGINKYVDFDMSKLDITVVSGYATYMAPYLIFVISFTQAGFLNPKFYTQKMIKNTQKH